MFFKSNKAKNALKLSRMKVFAELFSKSDLNPNKI